MSKFSKFIRAVDKKVLPGLKNYITGAATIATPFVMTAFKVPVDPMQTSTMVALGVGIIVNRIKMESGIEAMKEAATQAAIEALSKPKKPQA